MVSKVQSFALNGLEGYAVEIETDYGKGMVSFDVVGLPDAAVSESRERVRSAIKNSGFKFPVGRITVNLAPADIKKEGSVYDLPIAISLLVSEGSLGGGEDFMDNADRRPSPSNYDGARFQKTALSNGEGASRNKDSVGVPLGGAVLLGELALDGRLRPVKGILPMLISARAKGFKKFIIPEGNANEASFVEGTEVYALPSLKSAVSFLTGEQHFSPVARRDFSEVLGSSVYDSDLSLVRGQKIAKRALEIAVAGGHNILFIGPPGAGKTMLARCIPTIMPDMTFEEALDVTRIHSVAGELSETGIVSLRPFRTPHHTATTVSLCGGGHGHITPGEISLAHKGVLFLDELPEYSRHALESLRQPLEDGKITITRSGGAVTFPANFMLCASMNPCPCGNYGSATRPCTCTAAQIKKYRSKISGPLLDRIDIQVEVDGVGYDDLAGNSPEESSAAVKQRVERARAVQRERFKDETGVTVNADMGERQLKDYCPLSPQCERVLRTAYESLNLSARARSRIIKVARTIADLDFSAQILPEHVLEAASYRSVEGGSD